MYTNLSAIVLSLKIHAFFWLGAMSVLLQVLFSLPLSFYSLSLSFLHFLLYLFSSLIFLFSWDWGKVVNIPGLRIWQWTINWIYLIRWILFIDFWFYSLFFLDSYKNNFIREEENLVQYSNNSISIVNWLIHFYVLFYLINRMREFVLFKRQNYLYNSNRKPHL